MPETSDGVKFSQFPYASPETGDVVVGLHHTGNTDNNAKFTITAFITKIKEEVANLFVPSTRRINGQALSSDIFLDAEDVGARADNWMPTASDVGAAEPTQIGSISLSGSWSGSGPYSQTVTVTGATVTANSKVDIQLTATQIANLIAVGVTGLLIENNSGTLTAWAVGASPSAMTVQVTVTEVE